LEPKALLEGHNLTWTQRRIWLMAVVASRRIGIERRPFDIFDAVNEIPPSFRQ
jgi:hypothetical protein